MAHYVICSICGKKFDRDKMQFKQTSARRYAHLECAVASENTRKQEDIDREELEKYVMALLKEEYVSPKVRKQINTFIEEYGFTYSGIRKALIYFYEVKKNDPSKANGGIGIVPYCYRQAREYYYTLWLAQQRNEGKVMTDYIPQTKVVRIPPPQLKVRKAKHFSFFEEEEANE